jgi:ABC-2 type transport system ATP-binding protein
MLEFREVRKSFGAEPILSIEGQVFDNGIYWLQGGNGAGKTTLLRMIAGIVPFEGDILVRGVSQRKAPVDYRRLVGWADAEPLYPGFLTGDHLLTFYSGILRPDRRQIDELIHRLGVRGWLKTPLATWSSGMTKKLALLLAFLSNPTWILLDEPLITLDDAGMAALIALIREYHRNYGTGFLLSSHQPLPAGLLNGTRQVMLDQLTIKLIA